MDKKLRLCMAGIVVAMGIISAYLNALLDQYIWVLFWTILVLINATTIKNIINGNSF